MRLIFHFTFLLLLIAPICLSAQDRTASSKIPRVLILLDGSSSMAEDWGQGRTRFQQAGKFILSMIDSLGKANDDVEFGLRVFGHQYPSQQKNCYDTKLEIKFSRYNTTQMEARLEALHGYGVSPIAYSLSEAAMEDFENENKYAYSIILVTDGGESCDGDICKVVNDLLQRKIFFRPYIVSLVDYAPLKDLYSCLGTFLTVSTDQQMPPTISKIVDAHREGFVRAKTGTVIPVMPVVKKPDTITIPITIKETPKKVDTVVSPVKKVVPPIKSDTIVIPIKIKEEPKKIVVVEPVKTPDPKPVLQVRDRRLIPVLKVSTTLRTFKTITFDPPDPEYLTVPPFRSSSIGDAPPAPVVAPQPIRTKERAMVPIRQSKLKKLQSLVVIPAAKKIPVPKFVMPVFEAPKPETTAVVKAPVKGDTIVIPIKIRQEPKKTLVVEPVIKPVIKPVVKPSETPIAKKTTSTFTIEKIPATETQVELYFTDGNGTFYATSPQILLSDPATNNNIHKFYRTVDPSGKPDAQKVPAGTFNLSVVGSDKTYLKSITVEPNMINKIVITVSNGSLQFVWKGNANKKPVDKYMAIVNRNFVPQPTVKQRCDTVLPYPPGNYHIEVNTMPVTVRSTDLFFGATVIIPIDEPGTVEISNSENLGKVTFYFQFGDKFVPFLPMTITGNVALQNAEILPGIYEVHYSLGVGLPEKTQVFRVKSNEKTILELK